MEDMKLQPNMVDILQRLEDSVSAHNQISGVKAPLQKMRCLSSVLKEPKELAQKREGRGASE